MEGDSIMECDEFHDWRGRSLEPNKKVGVKGAIIACADINCNPSAASRENACLTTLPTLSSTVVEILENMVFLSCATNFMTYFTIDMHYAPAEASKMITHFLATAFFLTIFGGFISDSFIPRCWTFVIFITIEILGLITLSIQDTSTHLDPNEKPSHSQRAALFVGTYALATGVGGVKATLQAHGADQLDRSNKRQISSFFNWFFFSLCTGGLLSATVMVWVAQTKGWIWVFNLDIGALCLALVIFSSGFLFYRNKRPSGSPLTRIFKVLLYTARNWKEPSSTSSYQNGNGDGSQTKFRFLNKAMAGNRVSGDQVEETRIFLRLLPIFGSTIMMNCCLVQLQTFSVQQGFAMNRRLSKHFEIPPASLNTIPVVFILSSLFLYEWFANVLVKNRPEKRSASVQPLKRIGVGLALASGSMAVAAIVEVKRREAGLHGNKISVFWLGWQYLVLGASDALVLGGLLEFFYSQAPSSMRSMSTALAWCSTSMGYFLSSLLVTISNAVSGRGEHHAWLADKDMNKNRLDLFYTLLCILNFFNVINYVYWAKRY